MGQNLQDRYRLSTVCFGCDPATPEDRLEADGDITATSQSVLVVVGEREV